MAKPNWLRTDEVIDAVESLEMTVMLTRKVSRYAADVHLWKWVIISMHSAVQGFMVCSLVTANPLNVLTKGSATKWLRAHAQRQPPPDRLRLADFCELYERVTDPALMCGMGRKAFEPTAEQKLSLSILHTYRNDFAHFLPKSWSIEASGLPDLGTRCTEAIGFLAIESGNLPWIDTSLLQRCQRAIRQLLSDFTRLDRLWSPE